MVAGFLTLGGVVVGSLLTYLFTRSTQREQWLRDCRKEEFRELLRALSDHFTILREFERLVHHQTPVERERLTNAEADFFRVVHSRIYIANDVNHLNIKNRWINAVKKYCAQPDKPDLQTFYEAYNEVNGAIVKAALRARDHQMNIKEGMRRLALFAGVVGATVGGFVAYGDLTQVVAQRAQYKEFERSAAQIPPQQPSPSSSGVPPGITLRPITPPPQTSPAGTITFNLKDATPVTPAQITSQGVPLDMSTYKPFASQTPLNEPPRKPTLWAYILVAIYPILGFVVPWGTIRAVVWVGAGFYDDSK